MTITQLHAAIDALLEEAHVLVAGYLGAHHQTARAPSKVTLTFASAPWDLDHAISVETLSHHEALSKARLDKAVFALADRGLAPLSQLAETLEATPFLAHHPSTVELNLTVTWTTNASVPAAISRTITAATGMRHAPALAKQHPFVHWKQAHQALSRLDPKDVHFAHDTTTRLPLWTVSKALSTTSDVRVRASTPRDALLFVYAFQGPTFLNLRPEHIRIHQTVEDATPLARALLHHLHP